MNVQDYNAIVVLKTVLRVLQRIRTLRPCSYLRFMKSGVSANLKLRSSRWPLGVLDTSLFVCSKSGFWNLEYERGRRADSITTYILHVKAILHSNMSYGGMIIIS